MNDDELLISLRAIPENKEKIGRGVVATEQTLIDPIYTAIRQTDAGCKSTERTSRQFPPR